MEVTTMKNKNNVLEAIKASIVRDHTLNQYGDDGYNDGYGDGGYGDQSYGEGPAG